MAVAISQRKGEVKWLIFYSRSIRSTASLRNSARQVREEQTRAAAVLVKDPDVVPVMLTIDQAREKTGLSYDFLRKLCLQGKIVSIRAGSKYLINQDALITYLNTGTVCGA